MLKATWNLHTVTKQNKSKMSRIEKYMAIAAAVFT